VSLAFNAHVGQALARPQTGRLYWWRALSLFGFVCSQLWLDTSWRWSQPWRFRPAWRQRLSELTMLGSCWCIEFPTWHVGPGKLSTDYSCTDASQVKTVEEHCDIGRQSPAACIGWHTLVLIVVRIWFRFFLAVDLAHTTFMPCWQNHDSLGRLGLILHYCINLLWCNINCYDATL